MLAPRTVGKHPQFSFWRRKEKGESAQSRKTAPGAQTIESLLTDLKFLPLAAESVFLD